MPILNSCTKIATYRRHLASWTNISIYLVELNSPGFLPLRAVQKALYLTVKSDLKKKLFKAALKGEKQRHFNVITFHFT